MHRAGEQARHRLRFKDGTHIETDVLLFSAGIRRSRHPRPANPGWWSGSAAASASTTAASSDPPSRHRQCALWQGRIFGLAAPATRWPAPCSGRLCGGESRFIGADMSTKLR